MAKKRNDPPFAFFLGKWFSRSPFHSGSITLTACLPILPAQCHLEPGIIIHKRNNCRCWWSAPFFQNDNLLMFCLADDFSIRELHTSLLLTLMETDTHNSLNELKLIEKNGEREGTREMTIDGFAWIRNPQMWNEFPRLLQRLQSKHQQSSPGERERKKRTRKFW